MKFAFIDAEKAVYGVRFLCSIFAVSPSGFYVWKKREPSKRQRDDEDIANEIVKAHRDSRRIYGCPRIHRDLKAQGRRLSRKRVARLMKERGIRGRVRRRFRVTTDSQHAFPTAPDLVQRQFSVDAPNRVWVSDITCLWTREGWVYLAGIIDLYSRFVVGWEMSSTMTTQLCLAALKSATDARRPGPGLVHHSDRGAQYCSDQYRRALIANRMESSMSRKGNCWDNAVAESFWGTLKNELVNGQIFETRAAARQAVFDYIEVFYNRRRRHSSIGYVSPAEHESGYALAT